MKRYLIAAAFSFACSKTRCLILNLVLLIPVNHAIAISAPVTLGKIQSDTRDGFPVQVMASPF
ncbi:hypothetical protein CS542_00725 [Pedobacter sp. IW39]|nr:hypothetical protein CS542_00725 [Pedobacter sp. IW39]